MALLLQLLVMLSDIIVIGVSAYVFYQQPHNPLIWLLVILTWQVWYNQGGFMAWHPKIIKKFFNNDRNIGL